MPAPRSLSAGQSGSPAVGLGSLPAAVVLRVVSNIGSAQSLLHASEANLQLYSAVQTPSNLPWLTAVKPLLDAWYGVADATGMAVEPVYRALELVLDQPDVFHLDQHGLERVQRGGRGGRV